LKHLQESGAQASPLQVVSAVDSHGRTIRIADAHRGDGKRLS
jgi:hypothetical protein